uniref:Polyprotein n=1 Tax=Beach cabbage stralarivirus TaxID=3115811 RepID=A0AAT9J7W8_9SECO
MGRNLKYVSPADFNKRNLVNSSNGSVGNQNAKARCMHGLTRPGASCTSPCYKIFYPKKNAGKGSPVGSEPGTARLINCCPNCLRGFSSTGRKAHYREYLRVIDGHHEWLCTPYLGETVSPKMIEEHETIQASIKSAILKRQTSGFVPSGEDWEQEAPITPVYLCEAEAKQPFQEYYREPIGPVYQFKEYYDSPIGPEPIMFHFGSIMGNTDVHHVEEPVWLSYVTRPAGWKSRPEFQSKLSIISVIPMGHRPGKFCRSKLKAYTADEPTEETPLVWQGKNVCWEVSHLADAEAQIWDFYEEERVHIINGDIGRYQWIYDQFQIGKKFNPYKRNWFVESDLWRVEEVMGPRPKRNLHPRVASELIFRSFGGVSIFSMIQEFITEPKDMLHDGQVALNMWAYQYIKEPVFFYTAEKEVHEITFDSWLEHALAYFICNDPKRKIHKLSDLLGAMERQFFLWLDFSQTVYEVNPNTAVEASGFSSWIKYPFSKVGEGLSEGFIQGIKNKLKLELGWIWESCSFVRDLFVSLFDKMKEWLSGLLEGDELRKLALDGLLVFAGLLFMCCGFKMLWKLANSLNLPAVVISGAALASIVWVLYKYIDYRQADAFARAQAIWAKVDEIFDSCKEPDVEGEEECKRILGEKACIIDIAPEGQSSGIQIEAAGGEWFIDMGAFWKLLLLIIPCSTVGFAKSISMAKDAAILYSGREATSKFLQETVGSIQEMMLQITGRKNEFLEMLKLYSKTDFEEWRKQVVIYCSCTTEALTVTPDERLRILRKLKDQSETLMNFMDPKVIPNAFVQSFGHHQKILDEGIKAVQTALSVGEWKKQPFCLWLYGASGVGKSQGAKYFINDILDALDYPKLGRVYPRNGTDTFFSGYKNQPVLFYDDLGAVQEGSHFDESEIIKLVAPAPVCLNMASLGDKGDTIFTSDFVVVTANQKGLSPGAQVHHLPAFENRRHACLEVLLNPVPGTKRDRYQFRFFNRNSPYTSQNRLYSYQEVLELLVIQARAHFEEQEMLVASAGEDIWPFFSKRIRQHLLPWLQANGAEWTEEILEVQCEYPGGYILRSGKLLEINKEDPMLVEMKKHLATFQVTDLIDCLPKGQRNKAILLISSGRSNFIDMCTTSARNFWLLEYFRHNHQSFDDVIKKTPLLPRMQGFYQMMKEKFAELPFWVKCAIGACLFLVIGPVLFQSFSKLVTATSASVLGIFGCSQVFSAGSMGSAASSGDPYTQKVGSRAKQQRFILEGMGAVENSENLLTPVCRKKLLANQILMVNVEDPNFFVVLLAIGSTQCLVNYHVWAEIMPGAYRVYSLEKEHFIYTVRPSKCQFRRIGVKDIGIVQFEASFPLFPATSLNFLPDTVDLPKTGFTKFMIPTVGRDGCIFIEEWDCVASYQRPGITYSGAVVKTLRSTESFRYEVPATYKERNIFLPHQCGSLLIGWYKNAPTLFGFHYGRARADKLGEATTFGYGLIVTQQEVRQCQLDFILEVGPLQEDVVEAAGCPLPSFSSTGTVKSLGTLPPSMAPTMPKNTAIKPSLIAEELKKLVREPATEPAVLHQADPRLIGKDVNILERGMKKYQMVAADMAEDGEEEEQDFQDCIDEIFEPLPGDLEAVSDEVNLNGRPGDDYIDGIVASTSEGYPEVLNRKGGETGKWRFLNGVPGSFSIAGTPFEEKVIALDKLSKEMVPSVVGIDCPKDERLPLRKTRDDPKTRLFTVMPFEYNFIVRRYFLEFVGSVMKSHNQIPTKVGINCHSVEWDNLYNSLVQKGSNWFNGDYQAFDGITPSRVLIELGKGIAKKYGNKYKKQQLNLLMACTYRLGICGNQLFRVSGGIPSGFALTVIVNSLVNEFFLRFAWKKILRAHNMVPRLHPMEKEVHFAVYGDDNLVSVSDAFKDKYTLAKIARVLSLYGVTLKDGSDKTKVLLPDFNEPGKCDFLKRRMVPHGARVLCPLDRTSREERLFWVRDSDLGDMAALQENVESFMMEAFYESKKYYVEWTQILREAYKNAKIPWQTLPTWEDQERIFLGGGSKMPDHTEVVVIKKRGKKILTTGVEVWDYVDVKEAWKDTSYAFIFCGMNLPQLYTHLDNFLCIQPLPGKKYPARGAYHSVFRKVRQLNLSVVFCGIWDNDLPYVCAAAYCSYINVKDFSFTVCMSEFFPSEKEATAAITSVHGFRDGITYVVTTTKEQEKEQFRAQNPNKSLFFKSIAIEELMDERVENVARQKAIDCSKILKGQYVVAESSVLCVEGTTIRVQENFCTESLSRLVGKEAEFKNHIVVALNGQTVREIPHSLKGKICQRREALDNRGFNSYFLVGAQALSEMKPERINSLGMRVF